MTNNDTNNPNLTITASIADIQNAIDCHNKIANCLELASKFHKQAVVHHQNGYHEKAAESILKANGNVILATTLQNESFVHHAIVSDFL